MRILSRNRRSARCSGDSSSGGGGASILAASPGLAAAAARARKPAATIPVEDDLAAYEKMQQDVPAMRKAVEAITAQATPATFTAPPAVEEPEAPVVDETGANPPMTNCPHCQWPLHQIDIPEPAYADKLAFLHTFLGGKSYSKVYGIARCVGLGG